MERSVLLVLALCVLLPAMVNAARTTITKKDSYVVQGRVYCDTCKCGFETSKTTYIPGAVVRVVCKDRKTLAPVYKRDGKTDKTGTFTIFVDEDHKDQLCDAMLISSPWKSCSKPSPGRDRARVILTSFNGIASNNRYTNNMGFMSEEAVFGCTELLKQYEEYDNEE